MTATVHKIEKTDRGLERYLTDGPRTRSLRDSLKSFLKRAGLASQMKYRGIYQVWDKALKEQAESTRIVGIKRGVLQVEVDSASLLQDLEFQRHVLVKTLQAEIVNPYISGIHFRLASFDGTDEKQKV